MRVRYALWMDFLSALLGSFRKKQDDDDMPYSMVMLLGNSRMSGLRRPYNGSTDKPLQSAWIEHAMYRRNRRMRCWRHWSQNCWTFAVLVSTFPGRTISQFRVTDRQQNTSGGFASENHAFTCFA